MKVQLKKLSDFFTRWARDYSGAAAKIKANLVGSFNADNVEPLPRQRQADAPAKIYYFSDLKALWQEYNASSLKNMVTSVENNQMVVSEAPVSIDLTVTTCAAVTLYDRSRKVGAAMHFHNMESKVFKGYIALALHKMGALKYGRLSQIEARIMGIENLPSYAAEQQAWRKEIRDFLASCSISILLDETGKRASAHFRLSDGSIVY